MLILQMIGNIWCHGLMINNGRVIPDKKVYRL